MEDKYAKLLGLEFWLPDWFTQTDYTVTITLPVGTKFSLGDSNVSFIVGNEHWLTIQLFKNDNI